MNHTSITGSKDKYKLRNWKSYNKSLCNRGRLTLWIEEGVMQQWSEIDLTSKSVSEPSYPDSVILCCLLLKFSYGLCLRQTVGFVESLLFLLGKESYAVADYSTLCRRQGLVPCEVSRRLNKGKNLDIAIDSTGLKIYGEGEWKVRKHGYTKRRTWHKLHVGTDVNTQQIIAAELTGNDKDDAATAKTMLEGENKRLKSFRGDGAYDDLDFRKALGPDVHQIIPPPIRKGTKKKPLEDFIDQRNQAVEYIDNNGGKAWKVEQGYHKRSLNEVVMFRYKTIFGSDLSTRKMENQLAEALIKCSILNKYTDLGMPDSWLIIFLRCYEKYPAIRYRTKSLSLIP